ncbi:MAG: cytochrome c-type biogenesis protein CcmH [Alphaproteobacteria bacterium]|nr:cytochrome c-type biogenesis protein CcmH [Alphaproteobacteria bacterium]
MGVVIAITLFSPLILKNAFAITAEEMLEDPVLEKRARTISAGLRCLVCQNQSIDDSDAELAIDLRKQVRDYLKQDMSDEAIFLALREKYGEFVLLSPPIQPATYLLWIAPLAILGIGILLMANLFFAAKKNNRGSLSQNNKSSGLQVVLPSSKKKKKSETGEAQIPDIIKITFPVFVLILSVAIYLGLGRPDLNDQPLAERSEMRATAEKELEDRQNAALKAFNQAKARVEKNPESLSAQFMLAATASQIGSIEDEVNALEKSLSLSGGDARIKSQLAEALTRQADGQVTKAASSLISQALQTNPEDIRALYLRGLESFQKGEMGDAILAWQSTATLILPDSPLADTLRSDIAKAATSNGVDIPKIKFASLPKSNISDSGGNNALIDVNPTLFEEQRSQFSNLSEIEQAQFIQQMVQRLSDRLEQQPENFYGWLQLANAHLSMQDVASASNALNSAANAVTSDEHRIALIEAALLSHTSLSLTQLVENQLALLPDSLRQSNSIKFLEGEYWRQIGDNNTAIKLWSDILNEIPAEGQQAQTLQQLIAELSN